MNWRNDLKIGDKVIIHLQYGKFPLIKKIERITKMLIVTEDGLRFTKEWGYTPGAGWNKNRIEKWSEEKEARAREIQAKINYNYRFQKFDWETLSIEDLRTINKIIIKDNNALPKNK